MAATRIATSSSRDLRPLGTGGQLTIGAVEALSALLTRELTSAHAALFAEPQASSDLGEVDWYAEGSGLAEPLSRLPPEQAAPVQAELDRLVADIRALVALLRVAPGESDRFLAEMLELALHLPDRDAIRVRDGHPVLVFWGHERLGQAQDPAPVIGRLRHERRRMVILPPPMLPAEAAPQLWPWLGALAVSVLLLAGAAWLLAHPPRVAEPAVCKLADGDLDALAAWRQADGENAALRAQLAALVDDAGRRRLSCRPPAPLLPAVLPRAAEVLLQPKLGDTQRAQQRGGRTGHLQVVLAWDDRNDLDLHVLCPDNEYLSYHNRRACGGVLDVDANSQRQSSTSTPVENAYWSNPAPGTYKVIVDPFQMREGTRSSFRVTVRQEGQPDQVGEGVAVSGQPMAPVLEFQVQAASVPPAQVPGMPAPDTKDPAP